MKCSFWQLSELHDILFVHRVPAVTTLIFLLSFLSFLLSNHRQCRPDCSWHNALLLVLLPSNSITSSDNECRTDSWLDVNAHLLLAGNSGKRLVSYAGLPACYPDCSAGMTLGIVAVLFFSNAICYSSLLVYPV